MLFRDYVLALQEIISGSQVKIVSDLFKAAGAIEEPSESAVKSWLKTAGSSGYRNCPKSKYFPKDTIDETHFTDFLRKSVNTSWKEVQVAFCKITEENVVAVNTDDEDTFYKSLVNQFQKILKLPLSYPSLPEAQSATSAHPVPDMGHADKQQRKTVESERMSDVFYQNFKDITAMTQFIECNPAKFLSVDRIRDAFTFLGRINAIREAGNAPDKDTDIYQSIVKFSDKLLEYLKFLEDNSCASESDIPGMFYSMDFQPNHKNSKFVKAEKKYRGKLKSLYLKIITKIETQFAERNDALCAENRKIWHKG